MAKGMRCLRARARKVSSSRSLSMIATRLRREAGEGPFPEPLGRPAPGRQPPHVPFVLRAFLLRTFLRATM